MTQSLALDGKMLAIHNLNSCVEVRGFELLTPLTVRYPPDIPLGVE